MKRAKEIFNKSVFVGFGAGLSIWLIHFKDPYYGINTVIFYAFSALLAGLFWYYIEELINKYDNRAIYTIGLAFTFVLFVNILLLFNIFLTNYIENVTLADHASVSIGALAGSLVYSLLNYKNNKAQSYSSRSSNPFCD